jgi:hypothetical protein
MVYENATHQKYHEAFRKIVREGKIKPTRAQVSKRIGVDASSLKRNRKKGEKTWEDRLIDEIEKEAEKFLKKKNSKKTVQQKKIDEQKQQIIKLETALNESRVEQLFLLRKIRDLELELASKSKTSLAEISTNLIDWTKS